MNAAFENALAKLPAAPSMPRGRWWVERVVGDGLSPKLDGDDYVICVPCHGYEGPGNYALHHDRKPASEPWNEIVKLGDRCQGGVWMLFENPAYQPRVVDLEWINARTVGRVVLLVKPVR